MTVNNLKATIYKVVLNQIDTKWRGYITGHTSLLQGVTATRSHLASVCPTKEKGDLTMVITLSPIIRDREEYLENSIKHIIKEVQ